MTNAAVYASTLRATKNIVATLRPSIDRLLKILNFSSEHVAAEELSNGAVCLRLNICSGRASELQLGQSVLLRLKASPTTVRVEFPTERTAYYESKVVLEPYQVDGFCVAFVDPYDLYDLASAICRDLEERLLYYPPNFNQCPIYKQCRSAGYCVAPDQDFAAGCAYKRVLYQGLAYFKGVSSIR